MLPLYNVLSSFHVTAARHISGLKMAHNLLTDEWRRPPAAQALEKAGLQPLHFYLQQRWQSILPFTRNLEMFDALLNRSVTGEIARKSFYTDDADLRKLGVLIGLQQEADLVDCSVVSTVEQQMLPGLETIVETDEELDWLTYPFEWKTRMW